jgi:Zn-dependent M28 family amino/carboxypeptidase
LRVLRLIIGLALLGWALAPGCSERTSGEPTLDGGPDATPPPACLAAPDEGELRRWLAALTGEADVMIDGQPVRITERASSDGRGRTRAYLQAEFQALGYAVVLGEYDGGANVIASRPAGVGTALVVGAHFDAVPGVPGADDNASGVALQLAAARALSPCTLARELRFVGFDQEELGLVGSRAYVGRLRSEGRAVEIQGMLNLDMMGYDSNDDGAYTIFECGRPEAAFLIDTLIDRTRALNLGSRISRECAAGGDHRPFWDARIPAIAFGEEFGRPGADTNPCYHLPCDRPDRLNFRYLRTLAHLTAATAAALVGAR